MKAIQSLLIFSLFLAGLSLYSQDNYPDIDKDENGGITYVKDKLGNQIPDFSFAGYKMSSEVIPNISGKVTIPSMKGDATQLIQQAIDYVSNLKPDKNGFRGAVVLEKGTFQLDGTIYIKKSGIVLRGSGNSKNGTVLLGTGVKREAMLRILGEKDYKITDSLKLLSDFIPLGSNKTQLSANLKKGDNIFIRLKLNQPFIDTLGMNNFGAETGWIGWKPEDWNISWDRSITKVEGNNVQLSAPLTMSMNSEKDEIDILKYKWPGRIEQVGIENLKIESKFDQSNLKDEQHRWLGISIENARNSWVRRVNFENLAGGAVHILKTGSKITVEDCISENPVSEIAAFRRHTFYTEGQQTLFQRCYSEYGYHDFSVGGYGTTGPNAFVQCEAYLPFSFSGAIGSWATGILFDVVNIDGDALSFANQGQLARGSGWTAANSVIWESSASMMEVPSPPTAQNWAFGVWGQYSGNGHWKEANSHISPRSLFYAQLNKRATTSEIDPDILQIGTEPSSSPTLESAELLTREADSERVALKEWISSVDHRKTLKFDNSRAISFQSLKLPKLKNSEKNKTKIVIANGMLTYNGKLLTGKHMPVMWWRGSLRDDDVRKSTPHVTRFAPGKQGLGLTDDLKETIEWLKQKNIVALDHNYGLWYDRRMDDHQRIRRYDTDTWPPFYEQPFARSGKGIAWDHLSKYDLTKYNNWYWSRLHRFAELAEQEGQMLFHQQYFQHNILEAGAHWSSSPWRSANNINETGFPEPPPYAGDKRIFMARQFYDVTNEPRRKLHKSYIEKSLENFKNESSTIQFTSAEYTGPLHFTQFWVDVIREWEKSNQNLAFIGLSATKDVQDAILQNSERAAIIDVIDIKYWYYREDGKVYAPEGGKNLAPRQHARKMNTGKETNRSVYRSVREYRDKFPEKAVLYNTNAAARFGWAQLMATASLPSIPRVDLESFYKEVPKMKFAENQDYESDIWTLQNIGKAYLFYLNENRSLSVDLSDFFGEFQMYTIDPETGETTKKETLKAGSEVTIKPANNEHLFYVVKI
ncbi:DUF6298 domain-containing protein [Zunongwangia endophytica]|uniref:DUF6298 domain-containing protein n=1 Tax=Zunongwangia endophytica TaxID=1808945 RepID=A0ABV8H6F3_9FLAO|nr:DUF6298 domain-containing protein [Zunongwangia endophytica]MDN3594828.1 DUF6298 domain-containing protein [Zunongwangia endophytica]